MERKGALRLVVDLDAVVANYRMLCLRAPSTEIGAMVKADAYGLGDIAVSRALWSAGCRTFFVNEIGPALQLRAALPHARIFVVHGLRSGAPHLFRAHSLIPVLLDYEEARRAAKDGAAGREPLEVAIGIDAGLTRIGFREDDIHRLAKREDVLERLRIVLTMTQLGFFASRGHPGNQAQAERFDAQRRLLPPAPCSISASSGLFMEPFFHRDLARAGSALFGLNPTPGAPNPMRPVVRLYGTIIQVADAPAGTSIGYGGLFTTQRHSRIAIVNGGFADGILRSYVDRGRVVVAGRRAPMVGRVSMNLTAVDVTDIPAELVRPGAAVEILGPSLTPDEVAAAMGTVPQELLVLVGGSAQRDYLQSDELDEAVHGPTALAAE